MIEGFYERLTKEYLLNDGWVNEFRNEFSKEFKDKSVVLEVDKNGIHLTQGEGFCISDDIPTVGRLWCLIYGLNGVIHEGML